MGWAEGPVRVRVPATSANLGPGFDALGLALTLHDEVEARVLPAGLSIEIDGEAADLAGSGDEHLVVRAMRVAFAITGTKWNGPRFFGLRVPGAQDPEQALTKPGPRDLKPPRRGRPSVRASQRGGIS